MLIPFDINCLFHFFEHVCDHLSQLVSFMEVELDFPVGFTVLCFFLLDLLGQRLNP